MIKLYTKLIKTILIILLLIGCYIGLSYKFPNLNFLNKREVQIKDTKLIVEESKKIAQLFSSKFYSEMVIDSTKYITVDKIDIKKSILSLSNSSYKDSIKTKIVFIVSGNCYAGNELNKIKIIKTNEKKACHLILPNAKILNAVINPSDFNLFFDGGNWSEKEVQQIKSNAVKKIKLLAIENGIIKKANERTTKLLNNFLNSVGYEKITIEFKNDILENNKILKNN